MTALTDIRLPHFAPKSAMRQGRFPLPKPTGVGRIFGFLRVQADSAIMLAGTCIHPILPNNWETYAAADHGRDPSSHAQFFCRGGHFLKAAVVTCYGSPEVVKIVDVPKPMPAGGEILVRVHATTVNRTDCGFLRARPIFMRLFTGLRRPWRSIYGLDFSGEVAALGAGSVSFKPGERVFGMCPTRNNGAHAEYVCVPGRTVAAMPAGMRFDEAVVCEGAFYANSVLQRLNIQPGQNILIYGASGAIGTAMVQLAKSYGAAVTAVVATRHLALVKSLGADRAIDYTIDDFTRIGETFDCVVDAVGKTSFFRCRRLLKPRGRFVATDLGPWGQNLLLTLWSSITGSNRASIAIPGSVDGFVVFLKSRMELGQFKAVIDRKYPLESIADAYSYVETGQKTGIVVIDIPAVDEGLLGS